MNNDRIKIYVLLGQTATGKTSAGIEIAKRIDAEIISADSAQIYKGLNIGTAKPSSEEMDGIAHHLLDFLEPTQSFTVSDFQKRAFECVEDIVSRGKKPLVVGGTGPYIKSLVDNMTFAQVGEDDTFRRSWEENERVERGSAHRELQKHDVIAAEKLHPNDKRRVIRALEVAMNADKTKSELNEGDDGSPSRFDSIQLGLTMERSKLYERINLRVDDMLAAGLIEEVRELITAGVPQNAVAMQALGYKEIVDYLNDRTTLEDATEDLKMGTRRFAKRQNTWFKRDARIKWFDVDDYIARDAMIEEMMQSIL